MSAEVWAAIIGAGAAVVGVLVGQYWSANMTLAQLRHSEKQEELKWRREEGRRLEELRDQRLRELWALVLEVRVRGADLRLASLKGVPDTPNAKDSIFEVAARAYAVAITGLPDLREVMKRFYVASNLLEFHHIRDRHENSELHQHQAHQEWTSAFMAVEQAVSAAADESHKRLKQIAQTSP